MTTDIDAALRRLTVADHPGLAALEDTIVARIRERGRADAAFGAPMIALAAFGAIALGVTAGTFPPAPATAVSLSPLGPSAALAPSTLLASDR
ncbi:MAG: hypothetical protein M3R41_05845 [Pseudomonadota bacterium]|nr:hypothetical protein [Pseudomonadota bacterium]